MAWSLAFTPFSLPQISNINPAHFPLLERGCQLDDHLSFSPLNLPNEVDIVSFGRFLLHDKPPGIFRVLAQAQCVEIASREKDR